MSYITKAVDELAEDPLFDSLGEDEATDYAADTLRRLGGGNDPLDAYLVVETLAKRTPAAVDVDALLSAASKTPPAKRTATPAEGFSLAGLKAAAGWTDSELGDILQAKRTTVHAWVSGRNAFKPDKEMKKTLFDAIVSRVEAMETLARGLTEA